MSLSKLVSLAAVAAALCLYLVPFGAARPLPVSAADCTLDNTGTLVIEIVDIASGDEIPIEGSELLVKPDPRDFELDDIVVDTSLGDANTSQDREPEVGVVRLEDVCSTEGNESYRVSVWSLPGDYAECEVVSGDITSLEPDDIEYLTVEIDCTGVGPTPTATVAPTTGPAATVQASAAPFGVSCSGTSVISVEVRDAGGSPVATGTAVTISTTIGTLSPSSGFITGSGGIVYTFFTAPSTTGGTATITATAGSASGSTSVTVDCGDAVPSGTVAPPPTVGSSGGSIIQPPNTGDAGLASGGSTTWMLPAGVLLLCLAGLAGLGTLVAVRRS